MRQPFWTVAGLEGRIGVSRITLQRWKRTRRLPRWAAILIRLLDGELEAIDPAFAGWIIRRGQLVSPENWCFTPGEIRSIPILHTLAALGGSRAFAANGGCGIARSCPAAANDDASCGVSCEPLLSPVEVLEPPVRPAGAARRPGDRSADARSGRPPRTASPAA